jgi:DNA polymerase-1
MSVLDTARKVYARLRAQRDGHAPAVAAPVPPPVVSVESVESHPPAGGWVLVSEPTGLTAVFNAVEGSSLVALDTETTGLDPRRDRVRLLSLATGRGTFLVDCFAVNPEPLFPLLAGRKLVAHNTLFDLRMLAPLGFVPGEVCCTMLLSQVLHAERRKGKPRPKHRLEDVALRELGLALDKSLQRSDWSGALSREQLAYAAADVAALRRLHDALDAKARRAGLARAAEIEARCLPAMACLASAGVPCDRAALEALAGQAAAEAEALAEQLDAAAPARDGFLGMAGAWNWDSPAQVKAVFHSLGVELEKADDDALAAIDHPLAALIRDYRSASKRASTYGLKWLKHVSEGGRVYADWRQIGCVTGRMACGSPNLQNLPGGPYRRCFKAPPGRVLVKADYNQIELRIAAKVSGDKAMLDAYAQGRDLHRLTAQRMLGKEEVTDAERKLAKPVNFGLIYGLGCNSLRAKAKAEYGLDLSQGDATRYRDAFFAAYPGVARWHREVRRKRATETRTLAGRRVLVDPDGFYGGKVNYAVQGTGGDGVKLALALLWERRERCPGAFPVLAVHDEIVVEADEGHVNAAAAWLKAAMVDGMAGVLDPVPCEVEVRVAQTWGG